MSDDDERMNSAARGEDEEEQHKDGSSSDDDSSSSSSGSSSSSSDSESESENEDGDKQEGEGGRSFTSPGGGTEDSSNRKYSIESLSGSTAGSANGLAMPRHGGAVDKANAEPLNVNTTRAAARFREQASAEPGLMALGTRKRDRRTIEEIQRDLQKKRGKPASSTSLGAGGMAKKPLNGGGMSTTRASPPKSSPVMSPDSGTEMERISLGLPGAAKTTGVKTKANSARSRLEKKLLGRGGGASTSARPAAPAKKPATSASSASSAPTGIVTNISAGKVIKPGSVTSSSSGDHDLSTHDTKSERMEPKIEPRVVDVKPDSRVVRSVLRVMLRYGDLTDVNLFPGDNHKSFADEFKLPNFIVRSNLESASKMSEEKLRRLACDIADAVQRALVDEKKDVLKFGDVEMKPSQVIERLYENLKLRVAVQRALYDIGAPTNKGASSVYLLVAKHHDASVLGIGRDFPAWTWAEKEHDWNGKKDAALLLGIYVHGFGAWEDILNDDRLQMQQQRALKGERLKKRAENLLKRLPPPLAGSAGEPRVVQAANSFLGGSQNPSQALGDKISAIVNGASVKGGRMQRAAERFASRQASGASNGEVVPEDSIRKSHTQSGDRERERDRSKERDRSRDRERERERERERDRSRERERERSSSTRKPSISSPARVSARMDRNPEEGEVGAVRSSSSSSSTRRDTTSSSLTKTSSKRSASDDTSGSHSRNGDGTPRKKSKHRESDSNEPKQRRDETKQTAKRRLTEDEYMEKWKPSKKLKEIRQELKKMKIMADWSKDQNDEVVVEKVYKYVTTIGEAIDKIVLEAEKNGTRSTSEYEWDELCTALWTYAAEFTPFAPTIFERLYDDICADGERLRETEREQRRRSSATASL